MNDLGVIFDPTFSFVRHIVFIVTKSYSMLGFMMRICADFNAALVFKSLNFSLVRSHLEFAAVVWNPNYDVYINRLESIQKKFYSFLLKKFGYYNVIKFAPYMFKCRLLNTEPLSIRRKNACVLFVFNVLTG